MIERPSPNFDRRPEGVAVDMVVVHYTGMETAEAALARLCDPASKVGAHYVIGEDGAVWRLVGEGQRAWHAGAAQWRGETDVNGRSVGIELVNPGHEFGYPDFPEAQIAALEAVAGEILGRHPVPPRNVVGHADVAPRRRKDPGEKFPWARLAAAGIGLWPDRAPPVEAEPVVEMLAEYGYPAEGAATIAAFQRHFRPARIDGVADAETAGLVRALLSDAG